jgi:hypothetical protein
MLPCAVVGLQGLIRGKHFFRVFFRFVGVALLACLLPACWYWAAYQQGGEQFFNLVYEENVLRLMGKMSYSSHENPAYYNVITVVAGFVPYTLLPLIALFFFKYKKVAWAPKSWWQRFVAGIRNMDDARLFSLLSIVVIFVFYCIPKSKRSTYLLPIYPFIAYFLAEFLIYLRHRHLPVLRIFGSVMATLSCLLFTAFVAVRLDAVPETIFSGRHAAENIAFLHALRDVPMTLPAIVTVLLPCAAAYVYLREQRLNRMGNAIIYATLGIVFCIFFALDGVYQPTVLAVKSDRQVAHEVAQIVPEGPLYSYRTDVVPGNRMHPFTVNFYLGDRMGPFECFHPREGYVFMGVDGYEKFMQVYGHDYDVECVYESRHRSCDDKRYNNLYRFTHK